MGEALQAPILANSAKSRSYQKDTIRCHKATRAVGQMSEALYDSFLENHCPEGRLNERRNFCGIWALDAGVRPVAYPLGTTMEGRRRTGDNSMLRTIRQNGPDL